MKVVTRLALAGALLLPAFGADVPRRAPEFVIQTASGQKLLSNFRGKAVMIEFLFTTCPHCQAAARTISKLYTELGPKGFQPFGVAINDPTIVDVQSFVKNNNVNYPIGVSSREMACQFMQCDPNSRMTVPQYVFIDRNGKVVAQTPIEGDARWANPDEIRKQIESMLAGPQSASVKKVAAKK